MADEHELSKLREALEKADADLVGALDARARTIEQFIKLRDANPAAYLALPGTAEVVRRLLESAKYFPREPLERTLREVMGACAAMLAPVKVAVLAPEGGFSHVAAIENFGSSADVHAKNTIPEIFEEVERKRCHFGVVPFETSTDGAITETLDMLLGSEARISAELTMECSYSLVSTTGNAGDIDKIYATQAALAACEQMIKREFPRAALLDVRSGLVARQLAHEDHGAAAVVAGFRESEPNDLRLIRARIEDKAGVETRFVVVGHERPPRTGQDRTILALGLGDDPGSLHRALQPFAERSINLTRIESRRARGASWRYVFILELDGHVTDRSVLSAVDNVRGGVRHLRILGSYPRPNA